MLLTIGPDLEAALKEHSKRRGIAVDRLALDALRDQFMVDEKRKESHEEWLARFKLIARPSGISLSDEELSRENLYD